VLDVKIAGGTVVDGTGAARRGGRRDRQARRCDRATSTKAAATIDADGLVVAPGFIDIHTHYDARRSGPGAHTVALRRHDGRRRQLRIHHRAAAGQRADYLMRMLSASRACPRVARAGVPGRQTFGEYLDRLDGTLAVNAGSSSGARLRRVAMGDPAATSRPPTSDIAAMRRTLGSRSPPAG
jgi:N-acyl-D-aspartate/D-glutamate deacylase